MILMSNTDIENLLENLRIDSDRRDIIVGEASKRGLNPGEQRRLELRLLVFGSPADTASQSGFLLIFHSIFCRCS